MGRDLSQQALTIQENAYGHDFEHESLATTLKEVGNACGSLGDQTRRRELLERAVLIQERTLGPDEPEVAMTLIDLGSACGSLGAHEQQREALERALSIQERVFGPEHAEVELTLKDLVSAYSSLANEDRRRELLQRLLRMKNNARGRNSGSDASPPKQVKSKKAAKPNEACPCGSGK